MSPEMHIHEQRTERHIGQRTHDNPVMMEILSQPGEHAQQYRESHTHAHVHEHHEYHERDGSEHTIEIRCGHACSPDCPEHIGRPVGDMAEDNLRPRLHQPEHQSRPSHAITQKLPEHACSADCPDHMQPSHNHNHEHEQGHSHRHGHEAGAEAQKIELKKQHACAPDCPEHSRASKPDGHEAHVRDDPADRAQIAATENTHPDEPQTRANPTIPTKQLEAMARKTLPVADKTKPEPATVQLQAQSPAGDNAQKQEAHRASKDIPIAVEELVSAIPPEDTSEATLFKATEQLYPAHRKRVAGAYDTEHHTVPEITLPNPTEAIDSLDMTQSSLSNTSTIAKGIEQTTEAHTSPNQYEDSVATEAPQDESIRFSLPDIAPPQLLVDQETVAAATMTPAETVTNHHPDVVHAIEISGQGLPESVDRVAAPDAYAAELLSGDGDSELDAPETQPVATSYERTRLSDLLGIVSPTRTLEDATKQYGFDTYDSLFTRLFELLPHTKPIAGRLPPGHRHILASDQADWIYTLGRAAITLGIR